MCTIFKCCYTDTGYTWTITSQLGHMLQDAEKLYGERDSSYTILGVEVSDDTVSQIWFPGNCKHIAVQITENCLNDLSQAVFQVAHEVIHLLSPVKFGETTVLEEGLATLFSIEYPRDNSFGDKVPLSGKNYMTAYTSVQKLLQIDPLIIKKMRESEPTISKIDAALITVTNSNVPPDLAIKLTEQFEYDTTIDPQTPHH